MRGNNKWNIGKI